VQRAASAVPWESSGQTQRRYDERCPMGEGVVEGACRGVVLLGEPVDGGGAESVGECVDGVDEPVCNVAAAPLLGDVEVLQVAGQVR
jgi:hypothetical protein